LKALIVGAGVMGSWFARFWKENLGEVGVADINQGKARRVASKLGVKHVSMGELGAGADVVLVAVPIPATPGVVAELAPKLGRRTLLADLCSVKEEVVSTMQGLSVEAELASLHPLFGPGAHSIEGKDVLSIPVRTGRVYRKLVGSLTSLGARVTEMKAEEHDKLMSVIQCMTHFTLLVYLAAYDSLREFNKRRVRTPLFDSLLNSAKAILASDARLYGELQVYNRYSRIARARVLEACRSLDITLASGNVRSLEEMFQRFAKSFGMLELRKTYQRLYEKFEVGE
jgi:prephenate dehydrogenase